MSEKDFFDTKHDWSKLKHSILKYILQSKVFSSSGFFVYVDGFAGRGEYKDGNPGSPLVALDILNDVYEKKSVKSHSVFIELDEKYYADLESIVSAREKKEGVSFECIKGDFHKTLPDVLDKVGSFSGLFFVDTFNLVDYQHSSIDTIVNYSKNIDLIINFPCNTIKRVAGQPFNGSKKRIRNNLEVEPNLPKEVVEEYYKKIREIYRCVGYVPLKNSKDTEIFDVMFCTNKPSLFAKYNDFAYNLFRSIFSESDDVDNIVDNNEIQELKPILLAAIPFNQSVSQVNLYSELIENNFGVFKTRQYNECMREFIKSGLVGITKYFNSKDMEFNSKNITTDLKSNLYFRKVE